MGVRSPGHWVWSEEGSSPLNENACHTIDLLRHLFGEVTRVYAEGANYLGASRFPDGAAFTLRFASGAIAAVAGGALGVDAFGFPPRVSVHGTEGQAVVDGEFHTYTRLRWAARNDAMIAEESSGMVPRPPAEVSAFAPYPLLEPALRHTVAAVRGERSPLATADDGWAAVQVALAAIESARVGKPIDLKEQVGGVQ
jgi:predicted dehydrogenase